MTDKKFKDQLIHLIKNDTEVRTLFFELAKDEINEVVKEEIRTIIFEERYFEMSLRAYIKSLVYDDIHCLRMLNAGMVKYGTTIIEIPEMSSGSLKMKVKKGVNLDEMYEQYTNTGLLQGTHGDFLAIVNFEAESGYIKWTQKARKTFTYKGIFELYESIYDDDFFNLNPLLEKKFLAYISTKFSLGGKFKKTTDFEKSFNKIYNRKTDV